MRTTCLRWQKRRGMWEKEDEADIRNRPCRARSIKPDPPHILSDLVRPKLIVFPPRNDEFNKFVFNRQGDVCVYALYFGFTVGFFVFFFGDADGEEDAMAGAYFPVTVS